MNEPDTGIQKEAISFFPSYLSITIKTLEIKFTLSESILKTQPPVFKEGIPEEFLYYIHEFSSAKAKIGHTTYPKLRSGREQLLQGNTCNEWNTIKSSIQPRSQMVTIFNGRITAFKKLYIPKPSAVDNQYNYLQQIYEHDKYMKHQFLHRLKHINILINLFPDITIHN